MTPIDQSYAVLQEVTARAGIPLADAEPIRLAENDLWRLSNGVVVRISRAGQDAAAVREVAVARWLASHGVSAVRPLSVEQPVWAKGRPATFWEELPPHRPGTEADLAPLLRQLHQLPVPDGFELGNLDPFVRIPERLTVALSLNEDDRNFLLTRLEQLRSQWQRLPQRQRLCVIHGDAWAGNCIVTADGTRYLMDFERTALGQREWDLTSTAIALDTFGSLPEHRYDQYCDAYGYDVRTWSGYHVMRDVRELRLVTFALQIADQNPDAIEQAHHRLACVRGLRGPRPWHWSAVA
ncbi:phosphotransferase family protein [Streptomyces sp. NPDC056244]|uniref:phosphotransferase family protein n=1 Tax=Streptomyces sp. NPDC056244 TaxID=3345762 RepID=UPI0035DD4993